MSSLSVLSGLGTGPYFTGRRAWLGLKKNLGASFDEASTVRGNVLNASTSVISRILHRVCYIQFSLIEFQGCKRRRFAESRR